MRPLITALILTTAFAVNADAATRKRAKVVKPKPIPEFSAKSYIVADLDGNVFKEHDMDVVLPIASISKLMIGVLASEQDLSEELSIPATRKVASSIPRKVKTLTRKELLILALVRSDNFAAQILCANLDNCIDKMNSRAKVLEMQHTTYVEPTGLADENVSTANDLLKLMIAAAKNPFVTALSSMPSAEIETGGKPIKINNTNPLTHKFDILLSKTGTTNAAGGCLVMIINTALGQRALILLGSRNGKTRIHDMERLVRGLD